MILIAGFALLLPLQVKAADDNRPVLTAQMGHQWPDSMPWQAISPDGQLAAIGNHRAIVLWSIPTGRELRRLPGGASPTFSPDSKTVFVLSSEPSRSVGTSYDVANGEVVRVFAGRSDAGYGRSFARFAADGKRLLVSLRCTTSGKDGITLIIDLRTGDVLRSWFSTRGIPVFASDELDVVANNVGFFDPSNGRELLNASRQTKTPIAISPDGRTGLLFASGKLEGYDFESGKTLFVQPAEGRIGIGAFSPDSRFFLTTDRGQKLIFDTRTGARIGSLRAKSLALMSEAWTPDGTAILDFDDSTFTPKLVSTRSGDALKSFGSEASSVMAIDFDQSGNSLAISQSSGDVSVWDLNRGVQTERYTGLPENRPASGVRFTSDGSRLAISSFSGDFQIVERQTRRVIAKGKTAQAGGQAWITDVSGSKNTWVFGTRFLIRVLVPGDDADSSDQWVLGTEPGSTPNEFVSSITPWTGAVAVSPDGEFMLTAGPQRLGATLWDLKGRKLSKEFKIATQDLVEDVSLTSSGLGLISTRTASWLFDTRTGKQLRKLDQGWPSALSRDGQYVAAGDSVLDVKTGKELFRLAGHLGTLNDIQFSPDMKLAVTAASDGLRFFRMNDGTLIARLIPQRNGDWVVADREGRFDTNNLDDIKGLHWILPKAPLIPVPVESFMKEYYEPNLLRRLLRGEKLQPVRDVQSLNILRPEVREIIVRPDPDRDDHVNVSVEVSNTVDETTGASSGVRSLHLFRDGQLVGIFPEAGGDVTLDDSGSRVVDFSGIQLPRHSGSKTATFTAYCFNEDSVRSETASAEFSIEDSSAVGKGKAYVIAFGVDRFANSEWNLRYAESDSRLFVQTLENVLQQSGRFREVTSVALTTESSRPSNQPTKKALQAVLRRLAGDMTGPASSRSDQPAFAKATPDDAVFITFSTHGYTSDDGEFYLFPSEMNLQRTALKGDSLRQLISGSELAGWLQQVDAGQMTMIVDACHSAAAFQREGFKPGPMGSRGLGQLAYNKRMRILSASQAADVAFEDASIGHGLLTWALCVDGLKHGMADHDPVGDGIYLREWLRFGANRVPALTARMASGLSLDASRGDRRMRKPRIVKDSALQQPVLFDFRKRLTPLQLIAPQVSQ